MFLPRYHHVHLAFLVLFIAAHVTLSSANVVIKGGASTKCKTRKYDRFTLHIGQVASVVLNLAFRKP